MKYENLLLEHDNRAALRNALIRWVFGNDGYEGAIGGVTGAIPWNFNDDEHGGLWDRWVEKFDEAIGSRLSWDVVKAMNDKNYRDDLYNFIDTKLNRITKVYQQVVDELNNTRKYCGVVKKPDYVDGNGFVHYALVERVYGETKSEIVMEIWKKYASNGSWKCNEFVDAMFTGHSVGIVLPYKTIYAHFSENI